MKSLLLTLCLLAGCAGPGAVVDMHGSLNGHIRTNSATWMVAVGTADLDVSTQLPAGFVLAVPIVVHEGYWLAVNLQTGEFLSEPLTTPLPETAQGLFFPGEWEQIVGSIYLPKD